MPVDYKRYHPHWFFISWMIRFKRANNKCEKCGVKNYSFIRRTVDSWSYVPDSDIMDFHDEGWTNRDIAKEIGCTYVVLTVAHLDHDITNNHFSNLEALCQKCHLNHDQKHHVNNRKYGRDYKLSQLTLKF